jgi:hypothetical protein
MIEGKNKQQEAQEIVGLVEKAQGGHFRKWRGMEPLSPWLSVRTLGCELINPPY